jgi:uncharacterized repeat protein (TIGR01451 family)
VNWNYRVSRQRLQIAGRESQLSALSSQRSGERSQITALKSFGLTKLGLAVLLLSAIVLGSAGALLHAAAPAHASKAGQTSTSKPNLSSISLPIFFEPNQGQTDPRVKFLARGSGYGLFLTADEAVLEIQSHVETRLAASQDGNQPAAVGHQPSTGGPQLEARSSKLEAQVSIIRMHLEGANPDAKIAGSEPLPGKSNYFIGNDPTKWRRNIPQYARVNYKAVYPGVDLVYYGNQGQLEYDFRVAPGADPSRIALKFDGASTRLEKGDLVLSTRAGDIRFHAPYVYQQDGGSRRTVDGRFRQLADNKIGFEIGAYDRSRELVIDPTLFYSTFIGGGGESNVRVAVNASSNIYLAGSTTSANFPLSITPPPIQSGLNGPKNLFIAILDPAATGAAQLLFATYLGGNGTDDATAVAVDTGGSIYVAGSTTSTDFPPTPNAFQTTAAENPSGKHGFLSKVSLRLGNYSLSYSTYLAGSGDDIVTGLAIDNSNNAFVTGTTTSTDVASQTVGFPATVNGFQTQSNGGASQFFASKINTNGNGFGSMLYSTYFGGGDPGVPLRTQGGGIAVDTSGSMYFTGSMNFQGVGSPIPFPLLNAQQGCLNEPGINSNCTNPAPNNLDAFVAKINPTLVDGASLVFSTFLGGNGDDFGLAVAIDSSNNPYVTGETFSNNWNAPTSPTPFQDHFAGNGDAFIAKLGALNSGKYPLAYFTYLGGAGEDIGNAIAVDSVQAAHVSGSTTSGNNDFPVVDPFQGYGGGRDAFVGLISTTGAAGNYLTWLGGNLPDEATGIALDANNATYVAGDTQSGDFPTKNPFQAQLNGTTDAFVSKVTALSQFAYVSDNGLTVSPSPADTGNQVTFTFTFVNNGPEAANNVIFSGTLFGTGAGQGFSFTSATASPGGSCPNPVNGLLTCNVGTVAANSDVTITIVLVPTVQTPQTTSLNIQNPSLSANGEGFVSPPCPQPCPLPVAVDDFAFSPAPSPTSQTVTAGGSTSYTISLSPTGTGGTYTHSISMSASISPANSTITTSFSTSPITISGGGPATTTFNVTTQPRPVGGSSLWRSGPVYAAWLPVGGLSLLGLGIGASRRRRRWIAGGLLGLIAGIVLLQGACGNSSSNAAQTGGTPAGTYTITIKGDSGSASHSALVQLIVN